MDEIKKLASDPTKTSTLSEEKRLASDKSPSAEIHIPSLPPQVTTQVETGSHKERIRKATLEGGLKNIPNDFDDRDGDWAVIKSENPFEVLYLDHEQYNAITPEMVKNNFGVLSNFWDGKIHQMMSSGATKTQIIQKYAGEQGTEKTIQNYKRLLERAYKQLQSGIEKCFLEIDTKRREDGKRQLESTISGILADGKYEPTEKDEVLKWGWKANLRDNEITELLIKHLEANGFYPLEKIKDGANDNEKLSVVWVTKEYKGEEKKQDPLKILEQDFVAATKRDKALNTNTANFLYDKGADLGLDNSTVTDLIKKWGDQYRVDIKDGIPKIEIDNKSFELSGMEFHSTASRSFTISNTGAGTLSGTIKDLTTSNKPWLKVEQKNIDTQNKQEISFKVDTTGLDYGDKDTGTIEIQSNGGTASIEVKISIQEATEYIRRFRNKLSAAALLLGGMAGYFIYSLNFVQGMNVNIAEIAGIAALIGTVIVGAKREYKEGGGNAFGGGFATFIVGAIILAILAYFSHALSTVAWALTLGSLTHLSARSIWYARRRGEWKIPIAIGVVALILTAGIIIGGMLITVEVNKVKVIRLEAGERAKVAQLEAEKKANEAQKKAIQKIVSKLPGEWHGKMDRKNASLFITREGNQLSGRIIYEDVEESLSINVQFEKNNPVIILKGVSYKRKGGGSFSLDTFYGILSKDAHSVSGNYKDAHGNKGKWSVSRVSGDNIAPPIAEETSKEEQKRLSILKQGDSGTGTYTVQIPATEPWTNTGVKVEAGQILKITASGSVTGASKGDGAFKWVGPEGWGNSTKGQRKHLLPGGSFMALVGKIGKQGKSFYIGKSYEGQVKQSGTLYLGANDVIIDELGRRHDSGDPWWMDNQGNFNANILVQGGDKTSADQSETTGQTQTTQHKY